MMFRTLNSFTLKHATAHLLGQLWNDLINFCLACTILVPWRTTNLKAKKERIKQVRSYAYLEIIFHENRQPEFNSENPSRIQ